MRLSEQDKRKFDDFISSPQRRSVSLDSREVHLDEDKRTIQVAFSSEASIRRWFGIEVLGHGADEVSLDRFHDGAAVLVNHELNEHIGVIERAWIEGSTGRAILRFGKGDRAAEVFENILDGIFRHISVGYIIHEMILETQVDDGPDVYRVTDWEPFEISLVAVPADTSVGVGRSNFESIHEDITMKTETTSSSRSQRRTDNQVTEAERERVTELLATGEAHEAQDLARQLVKSGGSVADLNAMILDRGGFPATKAEDPSIGLSQNEIQKYSLCKAIVAAAYPADRKLQAAAALEMECSETARGQLTTRTVRGNLFIPPEILSQPRGQRNLTVGADGGDLVATNLLSGSFIDLLRNASVVQAAGALVLHGLVGNVSIPRQTGDENVFWLAENAAPTESSATFDQVPLTPKTLAAYSEISRKLLLQGTPAIEGLVMKSLADTIAIEVDRVAIDGSGAGEEPTGILNQAGVGVVAGDVNGLAPTFANIVALESSVSVPNALIGRLAYVTNSKAVGDLKQISVDAGSGRFLLEGRTDGDRQTLSMNGYKTIMSNNVPSDLVKGTSGATLSAIIFGNFADLIIGMWSGLDLQVNPYSLDTSGQIRITAFQDLDIALRHPQSFSAIVDVITTT
ncbi:MAG: phage major capsid protein [Proteobacteria bacterium]|nr:phage major capsid protein [Pseudomonadota bacterium]